MESKLPPELVFNFVEDEPVNTETGESNPNFIYEEDAPAVEEVSLDIPSIEKEVIDTENIFDNQKKDIIKPAPAIPIEAPAPPEAIPEIIPESVPPTDLSQKQQKTSKTKEPKLNKNGKPRKKREYTEEQKEAMRERLAKARAQVGKNRSQKQEEKAKEKKYQQLKKQTRDLKIKEMEQKVIQKDTPTPSTPAEGTPTPKPALTKEEIKDIQLNAIMEYDGLRKKRKAKKKEEQMIEQHKQELKNLVKKELGWQDVSGKWSNCY